MSIKKVSRKFKWVPMQDRVDKFGFPLPPRKPESKKPLLWIAVDKKNEWVESIFLVNETETTLENVVASTGGFQTLDDEILTLKGTDIEYINIKAGSAVKVDEYDKLHDSDYVLSLNIKVKIDGKWIKLPSISKKGGFKEEVLLWGSI